MAGAISHLNTELGLVHESFHERKYKQMLKNFRDIVVPAYKYMTRTRVDEPYMWAPFDYTTRTEITEAVSSTFTMLLRFG